MRTLVSSGADADLRSLRGISATDLGGVLAPHSWALHTQARILGDQYYLSPTDIDSNYPPLGQMLQTELYMEEAQSMVANRSWPSAVARTSAGHVDAQADAVTDGGEAAVEVQMATLQSMLAETDEAVAANARARAALERQREVERASDMAALHEQDARRQAKSAEMRAEQASRSAALLARIEERAGPYNARMDTLHDETAAEGARRAAAAAAAAEEAAAEAVRAAAAAEAAEMAAAEMASASTSDGVVNACHVVTHDDASDRTSPLRMSPARMRISLPEEPEVTGPVLVKGDMVTLARDAPGFFTLRCASCGGFVRSFLTEILQCDARVFSSRKPREKWLAQSRSERAGRGGLAGSR
eukprot:COSAG01_NODE_3889_length_5578_cov_202.537324_3_plen_358_part_00